MPEEKTEEYRRTLAANLLSKNKDQRKGLLQSAQSGPDYWKSRSEKLNRLQDEEIINNGMGVLVKIKTLFHGSNIEGVENFNVAENETIGKGIYFTSNASDAIGYAKVRSNNRGNEPIVYEAIVENVRLLDLRSNENVAVILDGFVKSLSEVRTDLNLDWNYQMTIDEAIKTIRSGQVRAHNLKKALQNLGEAFSKYVESLDYDGLIAFEGGEGKEVKNHDSYLIFHPEQVKITRKQQIAL